MIQYIVNNCLDSGFTKSWMIVIAKILFSLRILLKPVIIDIYLKVDINYYDSMYSWCYWIISIINANYIMP